MNFKSYSSRKKVTINTKCIRVYGDKAKLNEMYFVIFLG